MMKMKSGAKGTNALVNNFVPKIDISDTPIDEALAGNDEFIAALQKALLKWNRGAGKESVSVKDLIDVTKTPPKAEEK